jgi:NosR/NirI family nitrous oxide reductase transcriptional regulator
VSARNPGDAPAALSLDELDALIASEDSLLTSIGSGALIDAAALAVFLGLAMLSFFRKSNRLKYATLVLAVAYMGFAKGNLVSVVHLFGLVDWSMPRLTNSLPLYLLLLFTLVSTVLWGRLYCGRVCAFGALTQLMDRVLPAHFRVELPAWLDARLVYLKYAALATALLYFLVTRDKQIYRYIEPFWLFTLNGTTVTWTLLAILLLLTVFVRNFYCRYLCSVGALLGLVSNLAVFRIKRWDLCGSCKLCERICEWNAIKDRKNSVTECVRCDDCEILYDDKSRCAHWLLEEKGKRRPIPIEVER